MKNSALIVFIFLTGGLLAQESASPVDFGWKNGFYLRSADTTFVINFGGAVAMDYVFSEMPNHHNNRLNFKKARLLLSGEVYKHFEYKFSVDFAKEDVVLKDVYIGFKDLPVLGTVRVGRHKEPFQFGVLTGSSFLPLMQRAWTHPFGPYRSVGVLALNDFLNKRVSAQLGFYEGGTYTSGMLPVNKGYAITGRVVGLPYLEREKHKLLHVGGSMSYRHLGLSKEDYLNMDLDRWSPERLEHILLLNAELVYIHRAFSFVSEVTHTQVKNALLTNNYYQFYAEAGLFLTGESKNYLGGYSGFGGLRPNKNLREAGGWGAFEVVGRFLITDLPLGTLDNDEQRKGYTLGLNWYLTPAMRVLLNYGCQDGGPLTKNRVEARMSIAF